MWTDFDPQPRLEGDTLLLRPLRVDDAEGLYAAARDPRIWACHPARNRHERAVFMPYFDFLLEKGTGLAILDRRRGGAIIGTSSYYAAPNRPDAVAIGFTFLATAYWGGRTNVVAKALMLDHVFRSRDEAWLHIDPTNIRSQKATAKLGAVPAGKARLALGPEPADWLCYRLTRAAWDAAQIRRNPRPGSPSAS